MNTELDTENADRDLTSIVTVLTDTPSATQNRQCQGVIHLGDGAKDLDGTGGIFQITITIGGQTMQPASQAVTFSTAIRSTIVTSVFMVPANDEVLLRVLSPNGADTDVDVTAYLYAVDDCNVKSIDDDNDSAIRLALSAKQIIPGTVDTGSFTATTTQLEADDITEATADHFNGRIIIFTSGALLGQATDITDYVLSGANGKFTYTTLTEAPANDVTFIII